MSGTPTENPKKEKDAYLVTIGDILFAMKTTKETTNTLPEYAEEVYRRTIGKKIEVKGNGKTTPIFASGVQIGTVAMENSEEISMDHVGIATYILDQLSGVIAENGISFGFADAGELVEFAFGFIAQKSDGIQDAMWFPSVTLDPATALSYETSEDEFKEQDVSMSLIASGLRNAIKTGDNAGKHVIYTKYSNQRDTTLTIEDFVKQVVYDESQITTLGTSGEQ